LGIFLLFAWWYLNFHELFLIETKGVDDDFSLIIDADFSYLRIFTLLQVEDSFILPSAQYNKSYTFLAGYGTGTIGFTKKEIQSVNGGMLAIGFQNGPMWSTRVSISVDFSSSTIYSIFLILTKILKVKQI